MDKYKFDDSINPKTGKQKHVHLLNGEPLLGTSTVLGVLAKPLTWWASGLAVAHLGWTPVNDPLTKKKAPKEPRIEAVRSRFAEIKTFTDEQYLDCLDEAYRAHNVKLDTSAQVGTDMHAELEKYVKYCLASDNGIPCDMQNYTANGGIAHDAVAIFADWSQSNVNRFLASEAYCYSKRLWTGGIVDLVYEDVNNNYALLDFKSAKEAYDAHFMQNAGYDLAISANGILTKDGELVMHLAKPISRYSVLPFGMPEPTVFHKDNIQDYKDSFEACVTIHKLSQVGKNKF